MIGKKNHTREPFQIPAVSSVSISIKSKVYSLNLQVIPLQMATGRR